MSEQAKTATRRIMIGSQPDGLKENFAERKAERKEVTPRM